MRGEERVRGQETRVPERHYRRVLVQEQGEEGPERPEEAGAVFVVGKDGRSLRQTPEKRAERSSYFPINRLGTADDIAHAATFLCSDEAGWISGITIPVAGGQQATSDIFRWVRAHNPVPADLRI